MLNDRLVSHTLSRRGWEDQSNGIENTLGFVFVNKNRHLSHTFQFTVIR